MSLTYTGKDTLREIVGIVEEMPAAIQKRLLGHIKLERAKLLGKEISEEQKKAKLKVSDDEIAEMIRQYREGKNDKEIVKAIKMSEKGKHIKWADAKKEIMAWK